MSKVLLSLISLSFLFLAPLWANTSGEVFLISPDGSAYTNVRAANAFANLQPENIFDQCLPFNGGPGFGDDSGRS